MLHELRVENLLLIERAELRLGPGLNALTGETGAGKTVLAHAIDLLLGGKPRPGIVRPGAAEAYVEGVFALPDELRAELGDRLAPDADEIVLARRVSAEGRTRAYLGGRSATAADLRDAGGALLSFYGQHEHRKLTLASAQLDILDGFCGPEQAARRAECAAAHAEVREAAAALEALQARAGARDRELDLLVWELEEIERADPSEAEEAGLIAERERLRHLEGLRGAAAGGLAALEGDVDAGGGAGRGALAAAAASLEAMRGVDAALDALADRAQALALEADDLTAELRGYGEGIEAAPGAARRGRGAPRPVRPPQAQARRHDRRGARARRGVRAAARGARGRRGGARGGRAAPGGGARRARRACGGAARRARGRGPAAGGRGPRAARRARHGGRQLRRRPVAARGARPGRRRRGRVPDRPQPRRAGRPAARDGLGRRALARDARADERRRGGGGRARWSSTRSTPASAGRPRAPSASSCARSPTGRQVVCITHLPQIASLADRHFTIVKDASGETALTTVTELDRGAVVGELVRMLGADETDVAARRHAKELLRAA